MSRPLLKECAGEFLGTFIMVFIGCAAVGLADILGWFSHLYQVAICWGIGVALAIMAVKGFSHSHLNPAVSLAMVITKRIKFSTLLPYSLAQLLGAMIAASLLFFIFQDSLFAFEDSHAIIRGSVASGRSAMMFGEFFPNPSFNELDCSWSLAFILESLGTFILVAMIFLITRRKKPMDWTQALLIGSTVTILILFIAPYTQCGINPARDLGPRIFAFLGGWKNAALNLPLHSNLTVYVLGPMIGSFLAAFIARRFSFSSVKKPRD